jgi:thiol-disulfide isomerase/thioredoxin
MMRKKPNDIINVLGFVLLLFLAGCGWQSNTEVDPATPNAGENSASSEISINLYQGQERLGAEQIQLSNLFNRGQPVVLNLWAGLCPPCRLEMPDIDRVYEKYQGELLIIGIDVGPFTGLGSRKQGRELVEELGISYPVGSTDNRSIMREYPALGMPSTFFIKEDGTVHESWIGLLTEDKLEELVEDLLAVSSAG